MQTTPQNYPVRTIIVCLYTWIADACDNILSMCKFDKIRLPRYYAGYKCINTSAVSTCSRSPSLVPTRIMYVCDVVFVLLAVTMCFP